ncbi:uncharacterized protein MELLADRAFT_61449 [Melampsora larici-populina 98AG31]|uniref:Uncharacterized protein n=1 Tax=Melampsora larici-populina (strain 98AG31 / pathotype 3-4-7) TaxID=747676 RepID=F4REY0_MELLP|nr:uncharacterized protein MELLADRAFT_61449 [Melampsora larici-populina 98AG31]EGG09209.1 hypothetical protein MELLADRAFT_61449 [Melampsora larici-populina 98AG31]
MTPPVYRNWKNPTPQDLEFLRTLTDRQKSEIFPLPVTNKSHPAVRAGLDECFECGNFGHSRLTPGGCTNKDTTKKRPDFDSWRRADNGKRYILSKIRMSDADLRALSAIGGPQNPIEIKDNDAPVVSSSPPTLTTNTSQASTEASHESSQTTVPSIGDVFSANNLGIVPATNGSADFAAGTTEYAVEYLSDLAKSSIGTEAVANILSNTPSNAKVIIMTKIIVLPPGAAGMPRDEELKLSGEQITDHRDMFAERHEYPHKLTNLSRTLIALIAFPC